MPENHDELLAFKKDIEHLIKEWYENCPVAMKFTTKVIKSYKEHFGEDYASKKNND